MSISNGILYIRSDSLVGSEYQGFVDEQREIINHARTAINVRAARPRDVEILAMVDDEDFAPFFRRPDNFLLKTTTADPAPINVAGDVSGNNPAPWVSDDPNLAAVSREALGFIVVSSSGTDGSHHKRSATQLVAGGARFSVPFSGERTLAVKLLAIGSTERGVDYLFRWLETQLLSMNARPGAIDSIIVRSWKSKSEDIDEVTADGLSEWSRSGLADIGYAVLLEGPSINTTEVPNVANVRVIDFTLGCGDPDMISGLALPDGANVSDGVYSTVTEDKTPAGATVVTCSGVTDAANWPTPVVVDFPDSRQGGAVAPIINLQVDGGATGEGSPLLIKLLRYGGSGSDADLCNYATISRWFMDGPPPRTVVRLDYARRRAWAFSPYFSRSEGWAPLIDVAPKPIEDRLVLPGTRFLDYAGADWEGIVHSTSGFFGHRGGWGALLSPQRGDTPKMKLWIGPQGAATGAFHPLVVTVAFVEVSGRVAQR